MVGAVGNLIVAMQSERAFIIIGGIEGSVAVEVYVVTCRAVHEKVQLRIGSYIYEECHVDIGGGCRRAGSCQTFGV